MMTLFSSNSKVIYLPISWKARSFDDPRSPGYHRQQFDSSTKTTTLASSPQLGQGLYGGRKIQGPNVDIDGSLYRYEIRLRRQLGRTAEQRQAIQRKSVSGDQTFDWEGQRRQTPSWARRKWPSRSDLSTRRPSPLSLGTWPTFDVHHQGDNPVTQTDGRTLHDQS